jgi:hypothetical protein
MSEKRQAASVSEKQYGIRWSTGGVSAFRSREDAEAYLSDNLRNGAVLVVCEYEPGTAKATEWHEVEDR